jgi:hypothetical protein
MRTGVGAIVFALAAVTVPSAPTQAAPSRGAGEAAWTIMVYLDADNNLEATGLIDLQEMAEAAGPGVNFLVLIDRNQKDYGSPEVPDGDIFGLGAFTDAKLLKLNGGNDVEVLQELGEMDLMDPQNLAWFVWYGLTEYPAEHNGLVFWDHGGAALIPFGQDEDNDPAEFYSVPELQTALGSALNQAGSDRLDLIGFDTCLDAAVELTSALAPYAETFISSEEVVAGHGWDYTSLAVARGGADVSGRDVANAVIGSYQAHAAEPLLGGEPDYTMSVVDLDAMGQVDAALAGFVDAVAADPASGIALLQARQQAIEFGVVGADPASNFHQVDLGDLLARLPAGLPDSVMVARNALYAAIDRAVLDNLNGPAHEGAQGLSIYLPSSGAYYDSLYEDHPDPAGWRDLIKSILTGATAPEGGGGAPSTTGDLGLAAEADGWTATMELAPGSAATLAGGLGIYGVPAADGTASVLAILPASLGAGGADQIQTAWSYQFVRLDGQPVTADIEPMAEGFRAAVEGVYVDAAGAQTAATLSMELILSGGGLQFGNIELLDTQGGVGAIYPQEGSRFAPLLTTVSGSEIVSDDLMAPIDLLDFEVTVDELSAGDRFYASIVAFLPDGSDAVRSAVATRP